jgi:WD40 repeat protein
VTDFGSGQLVLTGHGQGTRWKENDSVRPVASVAIGRVGDRDVVVSGGYDGTVRIWDTRSGQQLGEPLGGAELEMFAVAIERTGDRDVIFAVYSNGLDVWEWDARSRQLVGPPRKHDYGTVHGRAIGRVGDRYVIVTGHHDRTVRLREVGSGEPVGPPLTGLTGPLPRPDSVAIGRLGSRSVILAGDNELVRVWDPGSGDPLVELLTDHYPAHPA